MALARWQEAAKALIPGVVGGGLFTFLFPRGGMVLLTREMLGLPGPGAGVALVAGPFAILCLLAAGRVARAVPSVVLAALAYAATAWLFRAVFGLALDPAGAYGTPWFLAAMAVCGLTVELMLLLARRLELRPRWAFLLAAPVANLVLLGFYWLVIFPYTAGRVDPTDIPLLLAVAAAGGLVSALLAWLILKWF